MVSGSRPCARMGEYVRATCNMRGCTTTVRALQMVKAPSTSTHYSDTTLLDARHFSDCAARSRGPSMALQSSKHCSDPAIEPCAKHALPSTASSAQHSLSPRTATRPSHVLGASRSLGDTEMLCPLPPPPAYSCPCAHSSAPFGVLLAPFSSPSNMTRRGHKLECTGGISLAAREAQGDRGIFGNLVSPRTLDYAHLHPSITLVRPIVPSCRFCACAM